MRAQTWARFYFTICGAANSIFGTLPILYNIAWHDNVAYWHKLTLYIAPASQWDIHNSPLCSWVANNDNSKSVVLVPYNIYTMLLGCQTQYWHSKSSFLQLNLWNTSFVCSALFEVWQFASVKPFIVKYSLWTLCLVYKKRVQSDKLIPKYSHRNTYRFKAYY